MYRKPQAQTAFTKQGFIHHTQQIFPDLIKVLPATASTVAAALTSTAATASISTSLEDSTKTPRKRGRPPAFDTKTGLPRQQSAAKSKASEKNTTTSQAMPLKTNLNTF